MTRSILLPPGVNFISIISIFPFTYTWKVMKIYLVNPYLTQNKRGRIYPYITDIIIYLSPSDSSIIVSPTYPSFDIIIFHEHIQQVLPFINHVILRPFISERFLDWYPHLPQSWRLFMFRNQRFPLSQSITELLLQHHNLHLYLLLKHIFHI